MAAWMRISVHEYALTPAHSGTQVQPSNAETELWMGMMGKERERKEEGKLFVWGFRWETLQVVLITKNRGERKGEMSTHCEMSSFITVTKTLFNG